MVHPSSAEQIASRLVLWFYAGTRYVKWALRGAPVPTNASELDGLGGPRRLQTGARMLTRSPQSIEHLGPDVYVLHDRFGDAN